jgi:hypothetical protein
MENELSYINIFDLNKQQIEQFVDQVVNQIEARQSLQVLARLTVMEKIVEGVKDRIKEQMLEEASLEGQKSFVLNGVKYEKAGRSTYYYNHCFKWNELQKEIKSLEDMMKAARDSFVDPETGEIIDPARQSYTEYIKVTIP